MMILYAIIVLGILIFVHELGHFLLAKLMGVTVEKFSLGFGPKLVGWKGKETEYMISAFPLGGYVKMFGEGGFVEGGESHHKPDNENDNDEPPAELSEQDRGRSFSHQPPLRRIAIVMAGPVFNLLFAWLLFIVIFMFGVPTVTPRIGEVIKDKPAARAGVQPKDLITAINGKKIEKWDDVAKAISLSKGAPVNMRVRRADRDVDFTITPVARTSKNLFGESINGYAIGVASAGEVVTEYYNPLQAVIKGTEQSWKVVELTVVSLVKLAQRVVPLDNIGGPIMIAKMAGEQAQAGGQSFFAFMALLSVNLGILNLLPVPVLDGGHLVFYFWELVTRRPVSQKAREYAQQIGLVLLLGLMLLAFYNDIMRYFVGQG